MAARPLRALRRAGAGRGGWARPGGRALDVSRPGHHFGGRGMTGQRKSPKSRWSVPIRAEDVPVTGQRIELAADEPTRQAIAVLAGLRSLPRLEASFEGTRRGAGPRVVGGGAAAVEQTCGVTLEPMHNEVNEAVDLVYEPPSDAAAVEAEAATGSDEAPEPLLDGTADLGAVATEFLLLGIDPYPRRPDAVFAAPRAEEPAGGAFADLAALKKDGGDRQT